MAANSTRIAATVCVYYMRLYGYEPATVINIGVGSCPELQVWKWFLPSAKLVGIDPRGKRGNWLPPYDYIQAAASDGTRETLDYCHACRATACNDSTHTRRSSIQATTIDEVSQNYPAPYFLWMDCEGSELDALKGAEQTLANCSLINLEVRGFAWDMDYPAKLDAWLRSKRYKLTYKHTTEDCLYRKY